MIRKAEEDGYTRSTRFVVELNRNEIRRVNGLPPLPEPVLGTTVHAFERMLDHLDVMDLVAPENRDKDSSRVKLNMSISDPRFYAQLAKSAVQYGRPQRVATMNVTEAFMVYFKVSLVTGLVLGSPWIFYQMWMFVAAGLYPHEKRLVNVYLPFSLGLFLVGVRSVNSW